MEKSIVFAVLSSLAMAAIFGIGYVFRPRPRTVQPVQQTPTPEGFAAAWNGGAVPPALQCVVQDQATGAPVTVFPRCVAVFTDSGVLRVSLSVLPDSPITTSMIASHAEDLRRALRVFFQVGMRAADEPVLTAPYTVSFVFVPVRPEHDGSARVLLGFDDMSTPVWTPVIGEITAISGDDGRVIDWLCRCLPEVSCAGDSDIERVKTSVEVAAEMSPAPSPVIVDVGDATAGKVPPYWFRNNHHNVVADANVGIIERSQATTVDSEKWAIAPSQTLTRIGSVYELERAGRKTRFTPAWSY